MEWWRAVWIRGPLWGAAGMLALALACNGGVVGGDDDDGDDDDDDTFPDDEDGDGFVADDDCDDTDPDVNPDADEIADGLDNDCDGYADTAFVCHDGTQDFETIQEGVDGAPDGFTVLVCPGTYEESVVIDGRELAVRSTDGADVTEVVGGTSGLTWSVSGGAGDEVTIDGFTVTGGSGSTGGGVACDGAALELRSNVVSGNDANRGGGLGAVGCELGGNDNTFRDNEADTYGGGVFLDGCSGSFAGNMIDHNEADQGGGLGVNGGTVDVSDNVIEYNEATAWDEYTGGGGVWVTGGAPFTGNTVSHNHASKHGGGFYGFMVSGVVSDNRVASNTCDEDGGGLYFEFGSALIQGNDIDGNEAYDDAGGLRVMSGACEIRDNTVTGNQANDDGGGVKLSHAYNVFDGNHMEDNVTYDEGGGLELDNDVSPVTNCTFVGNRAGRGGGLHSGEAWQSVWISDSTFTDNEATDRGGAIQLEDDAYEAVLLRLVVDGNEANHGGGICATNSVVALGNLVLTDNRAFAAATFGGGGIFLENSTGWLVNLSLWDNHCDAAGGIAVQDASGVSVANTVVAESGGVGVQTDGGAPFALWAYNDVHGSAVVDYAFMDDPTGIDGNLSVDPQFTAPASGDLTLQPTSPCIDTGAPTLDDPDGSRSDMGAYGGEQGDW